MSNNSIRSKERPGVSSLLFYAVIISAFAGTLLFTYSIGPIHFFPFRLFVVLLLIKYLLSGSRIEPSRFKIRKEFRFLLIWLMYGIVSTIWAENKIEAIKHIIFLLSSITTIYFIIDYIKDIKQLKRLFWLWIGIFVLLIPIGFWETFTGNHLPNSGLVNVDEGYEFYQFAPTTIFTNQNDFATMISFTMPMIFTAIRYLSSAYKKIGLALSYFAGALLLIFTTSRANYIALFIGLLFWFIFMAGVKIKIKFLATVSVFIIIIYFNLTSEQLMFLESVQQDFLVIIEEGQDNAGIDVRNNLIKNAFHFTVATFGFGVGAGNSEYYMEHFPKYYVGHITNIHNWWLENLSNYGVFIFILYVNFFLGICFTLWKIYRKVNTPEEKMLCEAFLMILVGFPFSSISSSSLIAFNPHWLMFGFILAYINYWRKSHPTPLN